MGRQNGRKQEDIRSQQSHQRSNRSNVDIRRDDVSSRHGGHIPQTVQHRSRKVQGITSPEPTRPSSGYKQESAGNVRDMNTNKFLQTDLKTYLAKDEHVTCISCQNCVRIKDKVLQYKYQPNIRSAYGATFEHTHKGHQRQKVFNLDAERRQLKVPYKPPR